MGGRRCSGRGTTAALGAGVRQNAVARVENLVEMPHGLAGEAGVKRCHRRGTAAEEELHVREQLGHGLRLGRCCGAAHALALEHRGGQAAAGLEKHHVVLHQAEVEASLAQDQVPPQVGLGARAPGEACDEAALEVGHVEAAEEAGGANVEAVAVQGQELCLRAVVATVDTC